MSTNTTKTTRPKSDEELEREALKWCEKLSRKLDTKRSQTKRRGHYDNCRR